MKPVIIGLHNPYSDDPADALVPYPDRSSGHRLWLMLHQLPPSQHSGASFKAATWKPTYVQMTERYNLTNRAQDAGKRARLRRLAERFSFPAGTTVVLLGHDVLKAFTSSDRPLKPLLIHPQVHGGVTWRWLPHPSGRSHAYNDPDFRMLAGLMLADILTQSQ